MLTWKTVLYLCEYDHYARTLLAPLSAMATRAFHGRDDDMLLMMNSAFIYHNKQTQ